MGLAPRDKPAPRHWGKRVQLTNVYQPDFELGLVVLVDRVIIGRDNDATLVASRSYHTLLGIRVVFLD